MQGLFKGLDRQVAFCPRILNILFKSKVSKNIQLEKDKLFSIREKGHSWQLIIALSYITNRPYHALEYSHDFKQIMER